TTFTFGLILAVALAGIGIGGAMYPWLFGRRRPTLYDLALSCAGEGLALAIPFALGDRLAVLAVVLSDMSSFGFYGQVLAWTIVTAIIVFPAAVISGIQFPLLIALLGEGERDVGKQVGYAFAWNTVGAVSGSLAGGFGLLPLLSAIGAWSVAVVLLAALAGVVAAAAYRQTPWLWRLSGAVAVSLAAIACLIAVGPTAVWRHSGIGVRRAALSAGTPNALRDWQHKVRRVTVWEADGRESSVALLAADSYSFYVNGKSDGNARQDANTQIMLGMLGAILHPDPKTAAVVGLGSGESAGWLAATPGVERVDVIELEPVMDEVARRCGPLNFNMLDLPNVRRIYNDAREVLLTTPDRYDLIVSEPSNPYRAGIASLYTREFYAAVAARLRPGGLFVQWLQSYEVDGRTIRTVLGTLHDSFPHVEVWRSAGTDMLLICSPQPLVHDVARLRARIAQSHVRAAIKLAWHTDSLEGVLGFFVAHHLAVKAVAQHEKRRNTDDHNLLEYGFARSVGHAAGVPIDSVLAAAATMNWDRPDLTGGEVDWDRADAERRTFLVLSGEHQFLQQSPPRTEGQKRRSEPIEMVVVGATAGAAAKWKEFSPESLSAGEVLLYAIACVDCLSEDAPALIDRVRAFHPLEADALQAAHLHRQGKLDESVEALHKLLVALRSDPTPHPFVIRPALTMIPALAMAQPLAAPVLLDGLHRPFSLMGYEEQRLTVSAQLAQYLVPQAAVGAVAASEPYPFWTLEHLTLRARIYRQAGDGRAALAEADLAEFLSHEPDRVVLPTRGQ
ncbi:MAG TPA: fused MFS/spermidine synthase, partial [Pirellulaceae bacterium]|nr:fused MFS/spermidine synthase [Pirellulaceae bacterium]